MLTVEPPSFTKVKQLLLSIQLVIKFFSRRWPRVAVSTYRRVVTSPLRVAGVIVVSLSLCAATVTHIALASRGDLTDIDQERIRFIIGTQLYPDTLTSNEEFGLQPVALAGQNIGGAVPDSTAIVPTERPREREVQAGETLSQIAAEYDLSSYDFLAANPTLESRDSIRPGMVLVVPQGAAPDEQVAQLKAEIAAKQAKKLAEQKAAAAKNARTAAAAKKESSAAKASAAASGSYVRPVNYKYVSQQYLQNGHTGIDLVADTGTSVRAAADGCVVKAATGWNGGYGTVILLKHSTDSYTTLYGHLSKLKVDDGDCVEAGDVIGLSGNTGRSTGPHLHFEVRSGGGYLNPAKFIK